MLSSRNRNCISQSFTHQDVQWIVFKIRLSHPFVIPHTIKLLHAVDKRISTLFKSFSNLQPFTHRDVHWIVFKIGLLHTLEH